jgi:uncharacterized RDD family membrane protein YckC
MEKVEKYNTVGRRFTALIIDGLLFLPFSYVDSISSNKAYFLGVSFLYFISWGVYTISLHAKYGQTLGKKLMDIKLLEITERNLLTLKMSFARESIWLIGEVIILIIYVPKILHSAGDSTYIYQSYSGYASLLTVIWALVELISMVLNSKKRSIQDIIANSIVIKLDAK